jgi:hypothetical protein
MIVRGLSKKLLLAGAAGAAIVAGGAGAASAAPANDADLVDVDLDRDAVHLEEEAVHVHDVNVLSVDDLVDADEGLLENVLLGGTNAPLR